MWQPGQPWRVVSSLQKLNEQIRAYAPRAVPPATDPNSWGAKADDAHSTSSDHYPHFYAALGTEAVVCARDFPHAPALGLDGAVVTEALRMSRDSRIGYLIFNRHITGPNHNWQWQAYTGSDPHDTHFHVSTVHTAAADDQRPWILPGGSMAFSQQEERDIVFTLLTNPGGPIHARVTKLAADLTAVKATVAELAGRPVEPIDVNALGAAIAAALPEVDEAAVVAALESPAGQAALTGAANKAEDS